MPRLFRKINLWSRRGFALTYRKERYVQHRESYFDEEWRAKRPMLWHTVINDYFVTGKSLVCHFPGVWYGINEHTKRRTNLMKRNNRKKIAILFGGCSSEYEVSLQSSYAVITSLFWLELPERESGICIREIRPIFRRIAGTVTGSAFLLSFLLIKNCMGFCCWKARA